MKKLTLALQVENILGLIGKGHYDAKQLRILYRNVESKENLTDTQSESLVEAIEARLWKDHPREAKKILGPRNTETRKTMEAYFDGLQKRFDLSANHHKNKVKLGGNVISGQALIYDYISYRNKNTRMIAHIAFRQLSEELSLEIVVGKHPVGQTSSKTVNSCIFTPEQFEASAKQFEIYLTSVLAGEFA
ncbi:MAG: hypothetical protein L3J33_08705 [Rhodobacteraceae bacterium]|nr:hypothetical protein [Paracoccaceae bacterium]